MTPLDSARWKELSPYLDRALEMPVHERASWLDDVRVRDPGLAEDLGVLLDAHGAASAEGFLKGALPRPLAEATLAGRGVGAYTLDAPIGQGGMGSVWRAHRSDDRFEAIVAVKLLNLALVGAKGVQRFRREASILAKLSHPNIARLLDAGVSELGQPYIVLEYVEGERIDEYCDGRRLTLEARLRLFLDVLSAVESAHGSLVVHRDLKPSNLLVTGEGGVKLLDFGIAKLLAERVPGTQEDTRLLTPEFAAPEQFSGAPVTIATDVYALGVLLHVLLCGRHPRGAPPAGGRMKAMLDAEAPRLCAQPLTGRVAEQRATTVERLRRALCGDLDNIVAKAMKADPRERYESVARLAEDIRRHLNDEPVSARADTLAYRAGKFVRKHRVGVVTAGLTLCALVGATGVTTWQMIEARAQRDEARYQTRRAQAVNDFMNVMMAQPGPATPLELLDKGRTLLEKQYAGDPAFMAGMLISIAGRYMDLGRIDKELETLEQAERIARTRHDDELLASVQCNTVDTEVRLGRAERAAARMQEARRALAALRNVRVRLRANCLNAETYLAWSQGDLEAATAHARDALALLESDRDQGLDYLSELSALASLYSDQGMYKESYELTARAREMFERTGRGDTTGALIAASNAANDELRQGEVRTAEASERSVIERVRARDGADLVAAEEASLYGEILHALARTDDALAWLRIAGEHAHERGNPLAETTAKIRLADALITAGRFDEAERSLNDASKLIDQASVDRPWQRIPLACIHARLRLAQGRTDEAMREIDALLTQLGGSKQPLAIAQRPFLTAAEIHLRAGDAVAAEAHARAALSAAQTIARDPQRSVDVGRALLVLGQARFATGDLRGAREAFERARLPITNAVGNDHPLAREAASWLAKAG